MNLATGKAVCNTNILHRDFPCFLGMVAGGRGVGIATPPTPSCATGLPQSLGLTFRAPA